MNCNVCVDVSCKYVEQSIFNVTYIRDGRPLQAFAIILAVLSLITS